MAVEAIWFTCFKKLSFSKEAMKNMQSLRILRIQSYPCDSEDDGSIEYLTNNLCWFEWLDYPWKLLPENFNPRRLVNLYLHGSSLHYLWNETKLQQFLYLRWIDLSCSYSLKRTPDFKGMPNLEYLNLACCTNLEEVHPSLKYCKKLIKLYLFQCVSLERFPYVNVESLESLNLSFCGRLRELPLSFFDHQPHLTELDLNDMKNLVSLRSYICKSKGLVRLSVSKCSKLESLPEEIGDLENLEELDASYTLISRPPSSIVRLNKLKSLAFRKGKLEDRVYFVFPLVNQGLLSLESLDLSYCNIIIPEDIESLSSLKQLNLSGCNIIDGSLSSLEELNLNGNNFEHLFRSIAQLGALESLNLSECKRLTQLPENIGCLSSLKNLYLKGNNFEHLPQSISELGALENLDLSDCKRLTQLPEDIGSLSSLKTLNLNGNNFEHLFRSIIQLGALENLDLSDCKRLTQLPEDIGCLSSLKDLNLRGNNFEHLPQSIFVLGALENLDLSDCKRLTQLPEDIGSLSSLNYLNLTGNNFEHLPRSITQLGALEYLDLSDCKRLTQLPEDIGCLSSLKHLYLYDTNFEQLPQSISELGALRFLSLFYCKKLTQLPKFPQQLDTIGADWSNDWICNSLFQNISSLQHDICSSHSLSLRVFGSWGEGTRDIPSWFNYQGMGTSVSVNLPENWYEPDKLLGFAVCYHEFNDGEYYIDHITAHLIPLSCNDGMSSMTQEFALSNNSEVGCMGNCDIHFLLVPLGGLWDASNANEKTPNDYGCIKLDFIRESDDGESDDDFGETYDDFGENMKIGVRLLYKNESELCIGIRKSRYEEEATCSSPKKQKLHISNQQ